VPYIKINGVNIYYIHIPKTGGSSIMNWFYNIIDLSDECEGDIRFYNPQIPLFLNITPQHFRYIDISLFLNFRDVDHIFSIVRNPYSRIISEYYYSTQHIHLKFRKRPDFNQWVQKQLTQFKKNYFHSDGHYIPQADFTEDNVKIFRYEDGFQLIENEIRSWLNLNSLSDYHIPHINKSTEKNIESLNIASTTKNLIQDIYRIDFDKFNYSVNL